MKKLQEYIVKDKRIFVGLEDSKRTWKVCVRCEGIIVNETTLPAEYENLRSYLNHKYPNCKIKLIYETGFSGFWLHDLLIAEGVECIVTPACRVTMEKVTKVKTDKRDARRLAKNLENGDYVVCNVPDKELREDRQISRTIEQITQDIIRTKNRIRKMLDYHGLNNGLPSGDWNKSYYKRLTDMNLNKSLKISLDMYLKQLNELENISKELKEELKTMIKKERYNKSVEIKESFPGVGWFTAIRLTLEWGSMERFSSGKHIASFTGLTASEYSTGETIKKGRITGQGSNSVRSWIIQCSWRAIRIDPAMSDKFLRVFKNSGSKKKAIVAVARKIVVRMRALELSGSKYTLAVTQ